MAARKSTDLHKRTLLIGAPLAVIVVAAAAWIAAQIVELEFEEAADLRIAAAAERASTTVSQYLRERRSALQLFASIPDIVDLAGAAGRDADRRGLVGVAAATLERRFAATGQLAPDTALTLFLEEFGDVSDFAALSFTERHGFTVTSSMAGDDFVQADEEWWQVAMEEGSYQGEPEVNEVSGMMGLTVAHAITDPVTGEPIGVMRGTVTLFRLARLAVSDLQTLVIEVVDAEGRVVISADPSHLLRPVEEMHQILRSDRTEVMQIELPTGSIEWVGTTPTNRGRWWVVVREPNLITYAGARSLQRALYLGAAAVLVLVLIVVFYVTSWLNRKVTQPVRHAGAVAGRVANGDLSASVATDDAGSEEVGILLSSVESMVEALRHLVGQIRLSSEESASMAEEISASTQEMSASTQEMANTCQNLSSQATQQADQVRGAVQDATRISSITAQLADGASLAANRNTALLETAEQHRERLLTGSEQLGRLASDLEEGVSDARRLADMSEQIEAFIKQTRAIATQTNMLALNAAIEASRAGSEGRGFAVVADEVRKLAGQAAQAAASTAETVHNVLATLQATSDRLTALSQSSSAVREIADAAAAGLQEVSGGAAETSAWTGEISNAAGEVRKLVDEITQRLQAIQGGTESVVAAAEQIAASAEEQSASTEEIASSAAQLAEASERLTTAVSSFRMVGTGTGAAPHTPATPSAA
ncbi:MAG: methyl-accepting chemotaxis protein [Gemmatimonadota bacterium]|nr:MAG: methyl-accepting chemotaxis protein [Gemmatimonadota bacterium]